MKLLLFICMLALTSLSAQAFSSQDTDSVFSDKTIAIAERLGANSISEIIEIVLKLQIECQNKNSVDVCEGVANVLAVLDYRVSSDAEQFDAKTIAFIHGLMEGVTDANQKVITHLTQSD